MADQTAELIMEKRNMLFLEKKRVGDFTLATKIDKKVNNGLVTSHMSHVTNDQTLLYFINY